MEDISTFFRLLWGTVVYRPYVYAFLACFIVFAAHHMGVKRMLTFMVSTYIVAFLCEFSATRNGFPFGYYKYYDVTRARELWVSNVPFWDSLSFVFLSYFSFMLAAAIFTPARERERGNNWSGMYARLTPWLGGLLMMLLDVVIDPLTLQGEKWFLGKIYDYPHNGFYFGVTAANFAGWWFVGFASQWVFQRMLMFAPWCKSRWRKDLHPKFIHGCFLVYSGVFIFNLGITLFIQDYVLLTASLLVSIGTLGAIVLMMRRRRALVPA